MATTGEEKTVVQERMRQRALELLKTGARGNLTVLRRELAQISDPCEAILLALAVRRVVNLPDHGYTGDKLDDYLFSCWLQGVLMRTRADWDDG